MTTGAAVYFVNFWPNHCPNFVVVIVVARYYLNRARASTVEHEPQRTSGRPQQGFHFSKHQSSAIRAINEVTKSNQSGKVTVTLPRGRPRAWQAEPEALRLRCAVAALYRRRCPLWHTLSMWRVVSHGINS